MFKVIDESDHHLTLSHPDGHQVSIAKRALSKKTLEKFKGLPRVQSYADGTPPGGVPDPTAGLEPDPTMERTPASGVSADIDSSSATTFDPLAPFKNIASSYLNNPVLQGAKNVVTGLGNAVKSEFQAPNPNYKPPAELQKASLTTDSGKPGLMNISLPQGQSASGTGGPDLSKVMGDSANAQLSAFQGPVKKIQKAEMDQAKAVEDQNKADAKLYEAQIPIEQQAYKHYQQQVKDLDGEQAKISKEINDNKLDPMRVWNSKGTGGKISTAIGIILGGIGAGLAGGENQALSFLHKQMADDLEAQKGDLGNKKTLLEANFRRYGNLQDAERATQLHQAFVIKSQLDKNAAMARSDMAKANAIKAGQEWELKTIAPLKAQLAQSQAQKKLLSGLTSNGDVHPAQLVDYVAKEPGEKKQILEEIKNREIIAQHGPKIIEAFKRASEDTKGLGRLTSKIKTPRSVEALFGLIAPLFESVDGTVRQAAFDAAKEAFGPNGLDSEADTKTRLKALQNWLVSRSAAPTALSKGLNLDKFKATKASFPNTTPVNAPAGYMKASQR